jgi:hypothetical protein
MSAKRTGCLRNFLAVAFTTIITPVLANVLSQDLKDWQQGLEAVVEGKPAATADWARPVAESAAPPPHFTPPAPPSYPVEAPAAKKPGQWHWAAGAWGQ